MSFITGNLTVSDYFEQLSSNLDVESGNSIANVTNLSGELASTGAKIWGALIFTSGNLATTGQTLAASDLSISGALSTKITNTGATLWQRDFDISGALQAQIAGANGTQVRVTGSSTLTVADITGIGNTTVFWSGGQVFVSGTAGSAGGITQGQFDLLSGNLTTTGAKVWDALLLTSGNLASTGSNLQGQINTLTTNLTATGVKIWNGLLTTSGNLSSTGSNLQGQIDTLTTNLTATGAKAWNAVITTSGNLASTGSSLDTRITSTGAKIWDGLIVTSGNLSSTGGNLQGQVNTLTTNLTATGAKIWAAILLDSGNLATTGSSLDTRITSTGAKIWDGLIVTSGNLSSTGSNLQGQANTLTTNLTATGAKIWGALLLTSGNLQTTGQTLANADASISGALATKITNTGVTLWQRDIDISGALATQIAGGGSVVKVTGSAAIPTADFTGIGGTKVFWSGGQVFVSGAAGGAGGGVPSVNGITNAVTIVGTGAITTSVQGNTIYVSGQEQLPMMLNFTAGAVTATNMALAQTFFAGSSAYITYANLSRFTGVSLIINKTTTAGDTPSRLFLRYKDVYNATATNWTDAITSPEVTYAVNTTNTIIQSGFFPIVDGAKSGVYLALCSQGGNGTLDPAFGIITAQFMG